MLEEFEYGETIPGVSCPACGGGLVHTASGAYCDWCCAYVAVVGELLIVDEDRDDEDEGDDE